MTASKTEISEITFSAEPPDPEAYFALFESTGWNTGRAAGIRDIQLFCAKGKEPFYRCHSFEPRPLDAPGMQLKKSA